MGQNASAALGARGRQDAHLFLPEDLTLVVGSPADDVLELQKEGLLTLYQNKGHFLFDPRADFPIDQDLAGSVRDEGVLMPIRIMRDGNRKLIVVGRQRVKAVARANQRIIKLMGSRESAEMQLIKIPALVYRADEAKAFRALIAENEQRVADTPLVKASKMQRAIDLGLSEEVVGQLFRVGGSQVKQMVRLLDLAPEVRAAIDSGEISASLGYTEFVKWNREEQVTHLKELRASGALKGIAAKEAVRRVQNGKKVTAEVHHKMRSRRFLERFSEILRRQDCSASASIIDFVLGKDAALNRMLDIKKAAIEAGWKKNT